MPTNRRASSPKKKEDIIKSEYPVISKTAYNAVIQGNGSDVNLELKRLCQGRNMIGQAVLNIDSAIRGFNPQVKPQSRETYQRLRSVRATLEKEYIRYPLRIES